MIDIARILFRVLKQIMFVCTYICLIMFALLMLFVITIYIHGTPSPNKFDRRIAWEYFWEKDKNGECVIDLTEVMKFEWDSAKVYSTAYSQEDIYNDIHTETEKYGDICSSLIFMNKGCAVYCAYWFPYPLEEDPGSAIFCYEGHKLTIYPHDAKFRVYKDNYKRLLLEKIEK